ncbi:hypothetical protein SNE40_022316 [Patella caerulea]
MRRLSIHGRCFVIQCLIVSQLWYTMAVLPLPEWVQNDINNMIIKFIWRNKPSAIKYNTIIGGKKSGGLGIPNLKLKGHALALKWLRKFFCPEYCCNWKATMCYFLRQYGNLELDYALFNIHFVKSFLEKLPVFYSFLLPSWDLIKNHKRNEPETFLEVCNEPLFNNKAIISNDGKVLYYDIYEKAGIRKIFDIVYYVKPGVLPLHSIYDIISTHFEDTEIREATVERFYTTIINCIPLSWKNIIDHDCFDGSVKEPNLALE